MSGSELRLSDLKRNLKPIVDELLDSVSNKPEDIEYLIDYALKELLYPKKRTAKDRIMIVTGKHCPIVHRLLV